MSERIALTTSVDGFFQEAVGAAVRSRQVEATAQARSYLVALLSDFAHPDAAVQDSFARPLAFLLDEALRCSGTERFQRLRALGDGVLYLTGFFGDHIENKGVDVAYVVSVGAAAYDGAAAVLRRRGECDDGDNVFGELSNKFDRFVDVLTEVAETALAHQARGERGLLKLYERWLKTGSESLAMELGARGIVPMRRSGGGLH